MLTLEMKKYCRYCDPWQTVHAVSIPLSYRQNYLKKVTMNFDTDRGKWSDSYSDLSCSSGHKYPRQELGGWGGRGPSKPYVMVIGTKSLSPTIITARQNSPWPTNTACYNSTKIRMFTHTNTQSHNALVFTQARNTNATSEGKSKLFRTYSWISTAITKLKNQNAVFIT